VYLDHSAVRMCHFGTVMDGWGAYSHSMVLGGFELMS